ncbi:MAG: hypothetical protein SGILL_004250, partial [Bacillariaceae sp.]
FVDDYQDRGFFDYDNLISAKDLVEEIKWFARYGAAVLFQDAGSNGVNIKVVGLDGWDVNVHASVKGRATIALADVRNPAVFPLGFVKKQNVESIVNLFLRNLSKSEVENTGDRRGQRSGHLGNQKTPSFLSHLLYKAIAKVEEGKFETNASLQGGTTDVGLHTGCVKRNTSFPLIVSVLYSILVEKSKLPLSGVLFEKCMGAYLMRFLDTMEYPKVTYNARGCDRVICVMQTAHEYIGQVQDDSFKAKMADEMESHYNSLENLKLNESCMLEEETFEEAMRFLRPPKLPIANEASKSMSSHSALEQSRILASKNLNPSDVLSLKFTGREQDCWLQMNRHNDHFWSLAKDLDNPFAQQNLFNISDEMQRLDDYNEVMDVIIQASTRNDLLATAVLKSYKALATWIVFCASHRTAEDRFPALTKYGAVLRPEDTL